MICRALDVDPADASMKVPALRRGNSAVVQVGSVEVFTSMKVPALRRGNATGTLEGWPYTKPQ